MSNKLPWLQWYPADWRSAEEVTLLSTPSRAIWFDLLNRMWLKTENRGTVSGTPVQLAKLARCTETEMFAFLVEAEQTKLGTVEWASNGVVTLGNRRILREEKVREQTVIRVARHRSRKKHGGVTPGSGGGNAPCNGVEARSQKLDATSSDPTDRPPAKNTKGARSISFQKQIPPVVEKTTRQ